jgi:CheY-like chemotaxis protein
MRILVVDDDAICRTLIVKGLEKTSHDTLEAPDGRQALRLLQSDGAISLLILDVMMPGIDGLDLLDQIRRAPYLAGLPVLICSALGSPETVVRAAHLNIAGYLLKPIDLRRLRQEVERIQEARVRPLADVRETLSRLEVDEANYLQMLAALLEKLSQELPEIKKSCEACDAHRLSLQLASLKGAAEWLGAEALSHLLARMSVANDADATRFISSLIPEMEKIAAELREVVQKLSPASELADAPK